MDCLAWTGRVGQSLNAALTWIFAKPPPPPRNLLERILRSLRGE